MPSDSAPLLEIRGLSRHFGGLRALHDVSFNAGKGLITGVIGSNGAGKTTLFNCISGLLTPSAGTVMLDGVLITGRTPEQNCKSGLARTFQIVRPFLGMSVLDNVKVGAFVRTSNLKDAEEKARATLDFFKMGHVADRDAATLGVAEMRRLEIARALATSPRLLLLDEMLAGLTATETAELCDSLRELVGRGVSMVLIEHSVPVMTRLCDHMIVLHFGEIICQGNSGEVLADERVREAYLGSFSDA